MNQSNRSWEATILLFAVVITATTGVAYRIMLTYNLVIPWFVWVAIVVVSALVTLGPKLFGRQSKP